MPQIAIDCPDDLLVSLGTSADASEKQDRFALAAKLYEQERLCSGKASRIAGMDRAAFLMRFHRAGVAAIDLVEDEMQHEARYAGRD